MPDNFSTNATVAKARALYGKRLKAEDYKELLHRNSVSDVAEYLKRNTHYRGALGSVDTNTVHRGFLEELLRRDVFDTYISLCRFQHLDEMDFYRYLMVQKEIELIITCILHLNAGMSEEFISSVPTYFIDYATFDIIALAKARNFGEILGVIRSTPYYDIIKDSKPDENGKYNCSKIEVKLRTYYIMWLDKAIDKDFRGDTAKSLHSLVKNQTDLINIINSYRLKSFFDVTAEEIQEDMLPAYGRLSKQKQFVLFEAKDADDYIRRLQKTYYGKQIEGIGRSFEKPLLENSTHALRAKYAKLALRSSQTAAISVYTILYLFEIELENIINIIEGIRYDVPTEYIQKLLII